jgi:hypothetical protein
MPLSWIRTLTLTPRSRARSARRLPPATPRVECLEVRCLPSGFRTIDGSGNNLGDPDEGQAGIDLFRIAPSAYADGHSAPSGANRPNARFISNTLSDQADPANPGQDVSIQNNRGLSDFIYVFGQFLDHDLDLTKDNSGQRFDIPPGFVGDPMGTEPFTRSQFDPATGTTNPRQQIQANTSWIDGSQIYGSDPVLASQLRTHVGGRLKSQTEFDGHGGSGTFLPFKNTTFFTNPGAIDMANDAHLVPDTALFVAGDRRANETTQLSSMHTLFLREHNRLADEIHAANPGLNDETVYQLARRRVGAELQFIVYFEWIPAMLGPNALPAYTGYHPNVTADIANEFSTAMFRFAHSQLDNDVERKNNDGTAIANGALDLAGSFFNPTLLNLAGVTDPITGFVSTGINPILKGAASANAQEVDLKAVTSIRNFLFGPPGTGTDLIARDIQRGRDHGLTDYNSMRAAYGLPRVTSFTQISADPAVQQGLQRVYGNVNNIDSFIGALAEDHVPGADVGPLTKAVLVNQFTRLRDGDRFFFLNPNEFSAAERADILSSSELSQVIERNTAITNLQDDVFIFRAEVSGVVFRDPDGNGIRESGEAGIPGVTVDLHDNTGAVIASQVTDATGEYDFTEQDLNGTGNYTVTVEVPAGFTQTAAEIAHDPGTISVSRGDLDITGQSFGLKPTTPGPGGDSGGLGQVVSQLAQDAVPADQGAPEQTSTQATAATPASGTDQSATGLVGLPVQGLYLDLGTPSTAGQEATPAGALPGGGLDGQTGDLFAGL